MLVVIVVVRDDRVACVMVVGVGVGAGRGTGKGSVWGGNACGVMAVVVTGDACGVM